MSRTVQQAVEDQLNSLTAAGAELHRSSARATTNLYPRSDRARHNFHRELIDAYLRAAPNVRQDGKAALITAGPPGAGKSTSIARRNLAGDGWRVIDADRIKVMLLERAVHDGIYKDLLSRDLADAHPIMANELASLVHSESTDLADRILRRSLSDRENVVVEGTLSWSGLRDRYLEQFASNDYRKITILDVEVDQPTAIRQARLRWWDGRQETIQGLSSLGGRFTPREAIDFLYSRGNRYSACNTNAVDFFNDPRTGIFDSVRLIVEDKTAATVQSRKYKLENGALTSAAPRYLAEEMPPAASDPGSGSARCVVCGRQLTSPASIARGAGASCAHSI